MEIGTSLSHLNVNAITDIAVPSCHGH